VALDVAVQPEVRQRQLRRAPPGETPDRGKPGIRIELGRDGRRENQAAVWNPDAGAVAGEARAGGAVQVGDWWRA
jgi:hypothetical protein